MEDKVKESIKEELEVYYSGDLPENYESMTFHDLGVDSLSVTELSFNLMKQFEIRTMGDEVQGVKTPGELAKVFIEKLNSTEE